MFDLKTFLLFCPKVWAALFGNPYFKSQYLKNELKVDLPPGSLNIHMVERLLLLFLRKLDQLFKSNNRVVRKKKKWRWVAIKRSLFGIGLL